jgi:nicotinamide mononucleotide transporter
MWELFARWLSEHYIEALGTIIGILYIFFSIRQNIFTWPTGIVTSALYVLVFFQSKLYAMMGLQVYYVFISIYGWHYWLKGAKNKNQEKTPVTRLPNKNLLWLIPATGFIYLAIFFILKKYTDSPVPHLDSLTTSLSIVATWMLARKVIENWLVWILVDAVSVGLYFYRGLWATTILFLVYTVMAIAGYFEWKKDLKTNA